MSSPLCLVPGKTINGWVIVEDAQTGRVGRVFIVRRSARTSPLRALKLCRNEQGETARLAIIREADRLEQRLAPTRMPALIERGEWHRLPYFVMEKIDDIDYPLPTKTYRPFTIDAFAALAELHAADLIHCDITPRHLGRKAGRLAFMDFDNAHTHREALRNRYCIGTDPYIAPEVVSRGEISEQSDIYALALMLIERCPEKLHERFEPVLRVCLRPEPRERPASAAIVAARLRTCKAPHHLLKAALEWTAVSITLMTIIYGLLMFVSYQRRRTSIHQHYTEIIDAAAKHRVRRSHQAESAIHHSKMHPHLHSQHVPSHQHPSPQHSEQQ